MNNSPAFSQFEYVCLDCGRNFDDDQPDYVPVRCECGSQDVIEQQ